MRSIISHPGKPLVDHLRSVATHCRAIIESGYYQLEMDKSIIADLVYIQGAVHDLGKATENFQTYIQSEGETVIRPKHHALISAYLARHIAMVYLEKCEL
ncbi:MAG: CRISPR-associated endonuclease Cas3'', partial [Bacteroidota bacterium]